MTDLHVVALSGGKDSTAMALRLSEIHPERQFTWVCTPTGNELPAMYSHWSNLREKLGGTFVPIMGGTLESAIHQEKCIPNWRQRFCTRILKIEPYAAWLIKQAEKHENIFSYVGLRADEPEREGGDYTMIPGINSVFPLRDWGWGIGDVMQYLDKRGVVIPERTDCAWCFFQTLGEWWILWKEHPDLYADAEKIEAQYGHTFRSPGRDTWPAALVDLRKEFELGRIPRGTNRQHDLLGAMQCRVCRI